MDSYNFWRDFFDTYQSLSDWMKFAWLVVPPAFLLGLVALVMRYRLASKHAAAPEPGTLAYTLYADETGGLRIYTHESVGRLPARTSEPALLPLPGATHPAHGKHPSPDI